MPSQYNLRKRKTQKVVWVEDDTLEDKDEDSSEDEDYEAPSEDESSVDESVVSEDEEEEEEDNSKDVKLTIPKGANVRVNLQVTSLDVEEEDEEENEQDNFLTYLLDKYGGKKKSSPAGRKKSKKQEEESDDEDEPALELYDDEQEYYEDLPKKARRKLNKQMKKLSKLVSDGDVPYKFRVLDLPVADHIKASVIKKIDILNEMDGDSSECYKLRTWVDSFLRLPFGKNIPLPVKLDDGIKPCASFLADTRKTLDKAVYGMTSAKVQIMQILAQWISNPQSVGNVIALKGPMGVGKTSFARSGVAEVLKRPFQFFSLGGASDISNFVGHSYTYEGSMPGRIAESLMSSRCMNPVLYFDEVDKISTTAHGEEIVSMLIHLTDRSQNSLFHDRYFPGVDMDLSQCLFVFSFNDESKIHPILKDRMQIINCTGYSADDKFAIVNQYIWKQLIDRIKLTDVEITDDAVKHLIREYSHEEEGVRSLIRILETVTTRINLLRIADEATAKDYKFYTQLTFPCKITVDLCKHILNDTAVVANESWRRLYT